MRILLIATNRHNRLVSRMNAQPLPIGMAYVAGHLDPDRHQLKVLDLMFSEDYLADVEAAVHDFRPELVGLSLRNLSNHSYLDPQWALPITRNVIDKIREFSAAPIVCGGPAFSLLPEECFAYLEPDLGLAGDAGETFAELASRIEIGEPAYFDLPGLVYRDDGGVHFNGMRCRSEFSMPPRFDELDMEKYRLAGFGVGIVTKLGDFNYPTSPGSEPAQRSAWRVIRPIEEVVREVKDMEARFNLRKVHFIDNGFNIPLPHAKDLCRALIDGDIGVHWTTGLAPYSCDAELVDLMKRAGCVLVMMGNMRGDSHDGTTLGERMEPMLETCRICEEGGLNYTIAQRFGEPGETPESVDEKLDFLRGIKPSMANLRVGVSIMPGTREAQLAVDEGLVASESDLIKPTFYLDPQVKDWVVDYLKEAAADQPRWNLL